MGTGKAFLTAFPDGAHEFQDVIVSGNQVVTRCVWSGTHTHDFMGIPATGRSIAINVIHIDRWVDGRITEHFGQFDSLGMMQQLGVIPSANAA
jgi:predicted ester cyclase